MPFAFGRASRAQLATMDARLQRVLRRALSYGVLDFSVLEGHRGKSRQEHYFRTGRSKVRWPDGKHNPYPSKAVDLAPWVGGGIPWAEDDERELRYWQLLAGLVLAAAAEEGVELRWGGDWDGDGDLLDQDFNDLGHFELR